MRHLYFAQRNKPKRIELHVKTNARKAVNTVLFFYTDKQIQLRKLLNTSVFSGRLQKKEGASSLRYTLFCSLKQS